MQYDIDELKSRFLFTSFFGCSPEKMEQLRNEGDDSGLKAGQICIRRAYRDLCRTLRINKEESLKSKEKEDCFNRIVKDLYDDLLNLFFLRNQSEFDEFHKKACNNLIGNCIKSKLFMKQKDGIMFSYGHAQKWVNMSMKYMLSTGLWVNSMIIQPKEFEAFLHAPVDGYILKASANPGEYGLVKPVLVFDRHDYDQAPDKGPATFSENTSQPWSRWNEEDYTNFQTQLKKEALPKGTTAISWENQVWIKITDEHMNDRIQSMKKVQA